MLTNHTLCDKCNSFSRSAVPLAKNCTSFLIASAIIQNEVNMAQIFVFSVDGLFWWSLYFHGVIINSIPYCSYDNVLSDVSSFCKRGHYNPPIWASK